MGSFLDQCSPMREALPLPHIASLTCFRSPPICQSASPIPHSIPPTSRKMSSSPAVKTQSDGNRGIHRQSSIPRPTSVLAHSPNKPCVSTPTSASSVGLQKSTATVQPQTYSRAQRSSVTSGKPTPPSSCESRRELLPRSDSLLPYNQRLRDRDLSGVRQQLHIRNYSTQSLTSLDAALSPNKNEISISLLLPAQRRLPKSQTSTCLTKTSLNMTPQRRLMKPIDPPLPRSQIMGSLSCFAGDGTKDTPSPLKNDSNAVKSGSGEELSVMDALQESRMSDNEVESYKQVTRETQMNKRRMQQIGKGEKSHSIMDARELSDSISATGATKRFGKINVTKNEEMDIKLLRRAKDHRRDDQTLPVNSLTNRGLYGDTNFANMIPQEPNSLTASNSGMAVGSNPDEEWEVDVNLVRAITVLLRTLSVILTPPIRFTSTRKLLTGQAASPLYAIASRP
jgi:hypothetical protein